ncbi:MAG: hypothetical protein JO181_13690 [Solirubrobacterales bacterium]|nr:hypothetical protein [Solirubrobacterales bacterium]
MRARARVGGEWASLLGFRPVAVASVGALLLAAAVSLAGPRARSSSIGPGEPSPAFMGLAASVIAEPTPVLGTGKRRHLVYEISLLNVTGAAERVDPRCSGSLGDGLL